MTVKLSVVKLLLGEKKQLLPPFQWRSEPDRPAKKNLVWKLDCRIRTGQTMPRGLWFRIATWQRYPNIVTMQLECDFPATRSHLTLYRLELSPFGIHVNGTVGPKQLIGKFIDAGVTHEHSFLYYDDNPDLELKADHTPLAEILSNAPLNINAALIYVCATLNIENPGDVPLVPLQSELV